MIDYEELRDVIRIKYDSILDEQQGETEAIKKKQDSIFNTFNELELKINNRLNMFIHKS